jgi:homoserine O-succinyltransferase
LTDFNQCEQIHGDPEGSLEALAAASADLAITEQPKVGLLNLMPHCSLAKTEVQWDNQIGVDVSLRFDDDPRLEDSRSSGYVAECLPFSEVASSLGALVITGANLELAGPDKPETSELLAIDDIRYIEQLYNLIDWAQEAQVPVVYSCLASHIALEYLHGLERERQNPKVFGVFDHAVVQPSHPLVSGLNESIKAPHSRWGGVPTKRLTDAGIEVIAAHEEAGWLVAVSGLSIFLQGHPEYSRDDLRLEHQRDKSSGQIAPVNYYPNGDEAAMPGYAWQQDARRLFVNIRKVIT